MTWVIIIQSRSGDYSQWDFNDSDAQSYEESCSLNRSVFCFVKLSKEEFDAEPFDLPLAKIMDKYCDRIKPGFGASLSEFTRG